MALKKKLGARKPAAARKPPVKKAAATKAAAPTKKTPTSRSKVLNASQVVNPFEKGTPRFAVAALMLKRGEHSWSELKEAAGGSLSPRSMGAVLVALEAAGGRFKKTKTEEYGVVYEYDKTAPLIGNHLGAEATGVADEHRQASRDKTLAAKKAAPTKRAASKKAAPRKSTATKGTATVRKATAKKAVAKKTTAAKKAAPAKKAGKRTRR